MRKSSECRRHMFAFLSIPTVCVHVAEIKFCREYLKPGKLEDCTHNMKTKGFAFYFIIYTENIKLLVILHYIRKHSILQFIFIYSRNLKELIYIRDRLMFAQRIWHSNNSRFGWNFVKGIPINVHSRLPIVYIADALSQASGFVLVIAVVRIAVLRFEFIAKLQLCVFTHIFQIPITHAYSRE